MIEFGRLPGDSNPDRGSLFSSRPVIVVVAVLTSIGAFIVDVAIPGGIAAGLLQALVLLIILRLPSAREIRFGCLVLSALVVLGGLLSDTVVPLLHLVANRAISVAILWTLVELHFRSTRLATERRFLASIVDSTDDAVIGKWVDGTIRSWNRAAERLYGWPAHEIIGRPIDTIVPPERRQELEGIMADVRAGRRVEHLETERVARNGEKLPIELTVSPVFDDSGRIVGGASMARDLTSRRRAEAERRDIDEKIQEVQRLESLATLAGGVAHDFNNLLVAILGNAELVHNDLPRGSDIHSRLDDIEVAAERAADLCRQLLAYSGRGRFVVERIDLSVLVSEMNQLLEVSVSRSMVIELVLAPDLPAVEADGTQIRQVVMNLLINAAEAIGESPGTVSITTRLLDCDESYLASAGLEADLEPGPHVCLEVSDTGCGMNEEVRRKLFEPFYSTKAQGRGLGLAGVLGIVRGHGGAIRVDTEPGRGSTFRVLLPACDAAAKLPVQVEPPGSWKLGEGGLVLVADDDDSVRTIACAAIRSAGFDVIVAADGREALTRAGERLDDLCLIVLDMTMPRYSGAEVFRDIRRRRADLPILVTSGYNEQEAIRSFAQQKNFAFIQKPWTPKRLLSAIGDLLQSAGVHRREGSSVDEEPTGR